MLKVKLCALFLVLIELLLPAIASAKTTDYKFAQVDSRDGLSNNHVTCIFRDREGFMWFGTTYGVNRYDGYSFKLFTHHPNDPYSIDNSLIASISEDWNGKLWVKSSEKLNIYDPLSERFNTDSSAIIRRHPDFRDTYLSLFTSSRHQSWLSVTGKGVFLFDSLCPQGRVIRHIPDSMGHKTVADVSSFAEDGQGTIWLMHKDGYLEKVEAGDSTAQIALAAIHERYPTVDYNFRLFIDRDDDLWITAHGQLVGVFYYNPRSGELRHINRKSVPWPTNTDIITGITQDDQGIIWIATDHGGINLLNKNDFKVDYLTHENLNNRSIAHNSITSMFRDKTGVIWLGTYKQGISYYHKNLLLFKSIRYEEGRTNQLSSEDVNCFAEDGGGNIWIGTNGGGLNYYNRHTRQFTHYTHNVGKPGSISNDVIVSLCIDHEQRLWIGTFFGGLNCFDGHRFKHYLHDPEDSTSISDNNVWAVYEDHDHQLWIGTLDGHLNLYNPGKENFRTILNLTESNPVYAITEDLFHRLWLGTADGIKVYNLQTGKVISMLNDPADSTSLGNNIVNCLLTDELGRIWVGTSEGLNVYDPRDRAFIRFTEKDGVPLSPIVSIAEDKDRNIWLGTTVGLVQLKNSDEYGFRFHSRIYDAEDGLQGKEFNERAAYVTKGGELFFGGPHGINYFYPDSLVENKSTPVVYLNSLSVFNQKIEAGDRVNKRVIINQAIGYSPGIVLQHSENFFTLSFSAISYMHPRRNQFAYRLEGFNTNWIYTDWKNRKATFTNLDPGDYVFRVKVSNNDGQWTGQEAQLAITILPVFWKTNYAYAIYVCLILLLIFWFRHRLLTKERSKFRIEREQLQSRRMHELDELKLKFFTNISHEFRTPLTLIISPLEQLIRKEDDPEQQKHLQLIYRNSRRLLNLVNQLLDFRKMDVQGLSIQRTKGELVEFMKYTVESFSDLSEKKGIRLYFTANVKSVETFFDHDKLEKIVYNLLSNAFKYTMENGSIYVDLKLDKTILILQVRDTGIGIDEALQKQIFERFFQARTEDFQPNQGSGIGLALVNEYVRLQNGRIDLTSAPGKGSCFRVELPLTGQLSDELASGTQQQLVLESGMPDEKEDENENRDESAGNDLKSRRLLLLVEDNEDFRFYLKDNFKYRFQVLEAENGVKGWDLALNAIPDLVISDIAMPEMDGINLCKKLKSSVKTSHIPVILLTAKASDQQKEEGLAAGADDYITKPFSFRLLELRVKNLIEQRKVLQQTFRKKVEACPKEPHLMSPDEKFIKKAIQLVEDNMENGAFSVQEMSTELGMSRAHLYKKLLSLTGETPIEFIRNIRLKRAAQLLLKGEFSVSEVAYRTGYGNAKYFTRQFKTKYGLTPSQFSREKPAY